MRTFRCPICGENVKLRARSKYVHCAECRKRVCTRCTVKRIAKQRSDLRFPRTSKEMQEMPKETWCRYCVAEEVLS